MMTAFAGSAESAQSYGMTQATGVAHAVAVQTPQRDINTMTGRQNIPVTSAAGANTQLLGGLAQGQRTNSNAVVSHYNVKPVIGIFATPQRRDLGALASPLPHVSHDTPKKVPNGARLAFRGHVSAL